MSVSAIPGFCLLGLLAGLQLWTQLTRWVSLIYVSASKQGGDFLGPPKRRLLWALPIVGLLHPAPWLLGMAAFSAVLAFRTESADGWSWFFGGLSFAVFFMLLTTTILVARVRRMRQLKRKAHL